MERGLSAEIKTKEPKNRAITQQNLPACKPVLDKTWVIFIFLSIAIVLIPIGAVLVVFGLKPTEVSYRYDDVCPGNLTSNAERLDYIFKNANDTAKLTCTANLTISKDITGPVYIYYELDNYYQNHRRYVRSRSDLQLANADASNLYTNLCAPQEYYQGNTSRLINPCGLTAWSYFNDTYTFKLTRGAGSATLNVDSKGIAYKSDIDYRFGDQRAVNFNPSGPAVQGGGVINGPLNQDERFINWMRLSAMPRFRKLWGKLNTDLKAGDVITVNILNQYNTYGFDGKKTLVLGNTTWLGGRNVFLGAVYVATGALSMLLGFVYTILVIVKKRKFGDMSILFPEMDTAGTR